MLKREKSFTRIVLVGSTSEIGQAILRALPFENESEILFVGKLKPENFKLNNHNVKLNFYRCDLENLEDVLKFSSKLSTLPDIDFAIMAAGYLPPENQELNINLINKTLMINAVGVVNGLAALVERMSSQNQGHILHISTVASIRPRSRNFTYGASKLCADFFAQGLFSKYQRTGLKVTILRPGFVYSNMTKDLNPAPLPISPAKVAELVLKGIRKKRFVIYAPSRLSLIFLVLKVLPFRVFNTIDRRV